MYNAHRLANLFDSRRIFLRNTVICSLCIMLHFFLPTEEVSTTEKQQSPGPSRFITHWLYTCVLNCCCLFPSLATEERGSETESPSRPDSPPPSRFIHVH